MGYLTQYTITLNDNSSETLGKFREAFKEKTGYSLEVGFSQFSLYGKWYSNEEDIIYLSTQFPGLLIEVQGVGEEPGDVWISWAENGKYRHEKAKIVYPKFVRSKLK